MDQPLWCAWCAKAVEGETLFLGIPFHWQCLKKCKAALSVLPKPKRDPGLAVQVTGRRRAP